MYEEILDGLIPDPKWVGDDAGFPPEGASFNECRLKAYKRVTPSYKLVVHSEGEEKGNWSWFIDRDGRRVYHYGEQPFQSFQYQSGYDTAGDAIQAAELGWEHLLEAAHRAKRDREERERLRQAKRQDLDAAVLEANTASPHTRRRGKRKSKRERTDRRHDRLSYVVMGMGGAIVVLTIMALAARGA